METLVVLGHFATWSQQLMGEAGVGDKQADSGVVGVCVGKKCWS